MTDSCSILSYDQIKKSGYIGKMQSKYLYVFMYAHKRGEAPMTHREATNSIKCIFKINPPDRNGRISELEQMGFLKKHDTVKCENTGKTVNRWVWTGRTQPLPKRRVRKQCTCCEGKGFVYEDEYYQPQGQMTFV